MASCHGLNSIDQAVENHVLKRIDNDLNHPVQCVFSTSEGYLEYIGMLKTSSQGYHESWGDIISTSRGVQYIGGIP